jgi:hypothetical protein
MTIDLTAAENLSNLTWLIFAFASVVLWRRKLLPGLGSRAHRSLLALICLVVFMFPVISISDDLHPDLIIAAEGDGKSKRLLKSADHASSQVAARAHGAALSGCALPVLVIPQLVVLGRLEPIVPSGLNLGASRCQRGRAPPAFIPA